MMGKTTEKILLNVCAWGCALVFLSGCVFLSATIVLTIFQLLLEGVF